ncbi:MAG TPA: sigma-70 family RNA polymerase sigma factor [Thermoanaerobaculia bacterium]|jgi:RNA polymerase sigma-70 factor (ECF subfamily)|nr:sigma-70 family RNA polymerase sigma factor [Thermoanaerobaculia bacterium]
MEERGGSATFEELAMPLLDALYRYARWLTRDAGEADDLVQEAYLKGLRGFGGFQAGSSIRAWMFRILRNTFLTSRTGLRAVPAESIDDETAIADAATPELHLLQRADLESLRRAIENLPVEFREVLLMSDVDEMSYKEIAEALSIPVGTVTSRLIRARQKVRKALRGER